MINNALGFIKQQLDQYLRLNFGVEENIVVTNSILELDGAFSAQNQNKIVITLINLEHETSRQFRGGQQAVSNNQIAQSNPALLFNLDLLFTAIFDDYSEALKFLTATISFFQAKPSMNRKNSPSLPLSISKLHFEVENISYKDTHNLWSAMGAKYQPSVIFKLRHISIDAEQTKEFVPAIVDVSAAAAV